MKPGSDFFNRSLNVAQRFLQTAVVIDDRAFVQEEIAEPIPHPLPSPPRPSTVSTEDMGSRAEPQGEVEKVKPTAIPDPNPHSLDAETIIESFAKVGIVCSVLKRVPYQNPAEVGTAQELFEPADILIIDWQTRRSDGSDSHAETLDFLGTAVTDSTRATPQQLRLVIVYTGAIDLIDVATQVGAKIENAICTAPKKDGEFAFELGPIRVVVIGKPSNKRTQECQTQQVDNDTDLARRAVSEFAIMTAGLVSNVALDAMAEIRRATHRILTRFSSHLDAPFLTHRALLSPPSAGNSQLVPLIVSELEAVLDDKLNSDLLSDDAVRDWLKIQGNPLAFVGNAPHLTTEAYARQAVDDICIKGVHEHESFAVPNEPTWVKQLAEDKQVDKLIQLTNLIAAGNVGQANEKFEALMSLRARYCGGPPMLSLGTILKSSDDEGDKFWLCMQPACDCYIRSDGPKRHFPLLLTRVVEQRFNLLAEDDGAFLRLRWDAKPYKVRMELFEANSPARAVVSQAEGAKFYFDSASTGTRFWWVGELKFPQAQRVAQSLSSEAGRVGLTESEWLRRNAK